MSDFNVNALTFTKPASDGKYGLSIGYPELDGERADLSFETPWTRFKFGGLPNAKSQYYNTDKKRARWTMYVPTKLEHYGDVEEMSPEDKAKYTKYIEQHKEHMKMIQSIDERVEGLKTELFTKKHNYMPLLQEAEENEYHQKNELEHFLRFKLNINYVPGQEEEDDSTPLFKVVIKRKDTKTKHGSVDKGDETNYLTLSQIEKLFPYMSMYRLKYSLIKVYGNKQKPPSYGLTLRLNEIIVESQSTTGAPKKKVKVAYGSDDEDEDYDEGSNDVEEEAVSGDDEQVFTKKEEVAESEDSESSASESESESEEEEEQKPAPKKRGGRKAKTNV